MAHHEQNRRIDYIEFPVADVGVAKRFYRTVFGWTFTDYGPNYTSFDDGRLLGLSRHLAQRMMRSGMALLPLAAGTLLLGMAIYHWIEGLSWSSAFLNAAMLLGGMGPVDPLHTEVGKWLAGLYALFAGLVFLVLAGVMLSPVLHHVLEHWAGDASHKPRSGPNK